MNMLSGITFRMPDRFIKRERGLIASPKEAFVLGIGMIPSALQVVDVLRPPINIVLGCPAEAGWTQADRRPN
jgi:ABC-type uncharacterized transport system ATPase subunit